MTNELRPYYSVDSFDAGYPVTYRPGVGVLYQSGKSLVDTLFSKDGSDVVAKGQNFGIRNTSILGGGIKTIGSAQNATSSDDGILQLLWNNLNSSSEVLSGLLSKLARNYFKVILNEPFDIVRLLLQVGAFDISGRHNGTPRKRAFQSKKKNRKSKASINNHLDDNQDDDNADYFFTNDITVTSRNPSQNKIYDSDYDQEEDEEDDGNDDDDDDIYESKAVDNKNHIQPLSLQTLDVMSSISSKEGLTSLWKATNVSYIYQALSSTLESWFTGFLSPFLEIPDPFYIDINYSPDPVKSLALILFASIATGLVLAPLDLIRTKLIITKINGQGNRNTHLKRSLRDNIKQLKSYFCPIQLIFPTILNSFVTNFLKNITPFIFSIKLQVENYSVTYEVVKLLSEFFELFLKLPAETILRRAQTSYLLHKNKNEQMEDSNGLEISKNDLVVEFTGYSGTFDTIFNSIYHGTKQDNPHNDNYGVASLYRGWRIGMLTIFARWGLRVSNYSDPKFVEERF